MANYGIHFLAGSKSMTPKQFRNAIAATIGGYTSNVELEIKMQRDKAAIRSLLQIAAIVFQRLVSRTPMDEEYDVTIEKEYGDTKWTSYYRHQPDSSVARYDWTMMISGENVKIFSCKEFVAKDPNFGIEFNNKKDINLILDTLLKSNLKPKIITNSKGEEIPDFQVSFDNPNPHFKKLEYGLYKKGPTEPKEGENYVHGITEDNYSYQAPKGFYAITMKEYEAFIQTHEGDRWRSLSQKMLRQKVEKVFSEKKFSQIMSSLSSDILNQGTPEGAFNKAVDKNEKDAEKDNERKLQEELKKEPISKEEEISPEQYVFDHYHDGYWKNEFKSISEIKKDSEFKKDFEKDVLKEKQRRNAKKWQGGK